jgi:hypothetical protein
MGESVKIINLAKKNDYPKWYARRPRYWN